jgi:hypothetical protein
MKRNMFEKVSLLILLASVSICGCKRQSQQPATASEIISTGALAGPSLSKITARTPNSGGSSLYIDIEGNNLGGKDWKASLKPINGTSGSSATVTTTVGITASAARLLVDTGTALVQGTYQLIVSNAYGDATALVTTLKGDTGATGATGAQGPAGAAGQAGADSKTIAQLLIDNPNRIFTGTSKLYCSYINGGPGYYSCWSADLTPSEDVLISDVSCFTEDTQITSQISISVFYDCQKNTVVGAPPTYTGCTASDTLSVISTGNVLSTFSAVTPIPVRSGRVIYVGYANHVDSTLPFIVKCSFRGIKKNI